jgi:hypothetical protein
MDVTANNITNVNINNFTKSLAGMEESYPSGVEVSISQVDATGDPLPSDDASPPSERYQNRKSSNVDLAESRSS